ncbi:MAG TPA: hypothetical protein VK635_14745, partial [Bradyrhizobium sp.]|nr:hypothetical protein [Bradyrhizobium sp.]
MHNLDGLQTSRSTIGPGDLGAEQQADTQAVKRQRERGRNLGARIDNGNYLGPRRAEIQGCPPPVVRSREDDRTARRNGCKPVEIGPDCRRQHDAGSVIVSKSDRSFDSAHRVDATLRHKMPQPLARKTSWWRWQMISNPLQRTVSSAIVGAEYLCSPEDARVRHRGQFILHRSGELGTGSAIDFVA